MPKYGFTVRCVKRDNIERRCLSKPKWWELWKGLTCDEVEVSLKVFWISLKTRNDLDIFLLTENKSEAHIFKSNKEAREILSTIYRTYDMFKDTIVE